jgi:hypothetical protein
MAIDFPASPTNGQTFTSGSVTYTYDGTKWTALASGGSSQWTTSGSNIYYNTGSVGIGSNNPQSLLHLETDGTALRIVRGSSTGFLYNTGTASTSTTRLQGNDGPVELYTNAAQPVVFSSNTAERARIDSSGRLLVGTSSARSNVYYKTANLTPQVLFETQKGDFSGGLALINCSASGYPGVLTLGQSYTNTLGGNGLTTNGEPLGIINFVANDGTNFRSGAVIEANIDATSGSGDVPTRLVFSTTADGASSPTARYQIKNTGNSNMFAAADVLYLESATSASTSTYLIWGGYSASGLGGASTNSFRVATNGNVTNTNNSYGAISDIKLKENIVDATSQWNDIKTLQVRKYNFKQGQTHTQIGLIAQEVELVSPGLVTESPDRDEEGNDLGTVTKSVNYSVLYMKAVKALQEAMERIETLEAKVAALEGA